MFIHKGYNKSLSLLLSGSSPTDHSGFESRKKHVRSLSYDTKKGVKWTSDIHSPDSWYEKIKPRQKRKLWFKGWAFWMIRTDFILKHIHILHEISYRTASSEVIHILIMKLQSFKRFLHQSPRYNSVPYIHTVVTSRLCRWVVEFTSSLRPEAAVYGELDTKSKNSSWLGGFFVHLRDFLLWSAREEILHHKLSIPTLWNDVSYTPRTLYFTRLQSLYTHH